MYHTHINSLRQEMMGLGGALIILEPNQERIHRDYFIMLQEFKIKDLKHGEIKEGTFDIDPIAMDFNFFTMNGRCFPFTTPLEVKYGEIMRIRLGNIMHDAHPIHIHGHQFYVTASDGNQIKMENWLKKNTINVA